MFYRQTYLADNQTLADAGTMTMDINVTDPITAIWLKFQATNGATDNRGNTLAQCISAIEVIDGADVIYSLDGCEALALAAYQLGRMPRQEVDEQGGAVFTLTVPIMFGRYLGDPDYAFDPRKFVNPQIRISWNLGTVRAVAATAFATGTLQLSAVAHIMEGTPVPTKLLMAKEVYTWPSVAAATSYIDMPVDHRWRGLMLRGVLFGNPWHWMYDQIRLNCDGGKFIAMNSRGWDLMNQMTMFQERFAYRHDFAAGNGTVLQAILGEFETMTLLPAVIVDCVAEYSSTGAGSGSLQLRTAGVLDGVNRHLLADVTGYNPYDCLYLPFGRQDTPGDWFPAPTFRGVKLEVRAGVNAALMYVVVVQDRSY